MRGQSEELCKKTSYYVNLASLLLANRRKIGKTDFLRYLTLPKMVKICEKFVIEIIATCMRNNNLLVRLMLQ